MLVLGHIGITFGVALCAESLRHQTRDAAPGLSQRLRQRLVLATASLSRRVDLRILLIGSLLPDLIDKPLGLVLLSRSFGTGRLCCHSLLFAAILALLGLYLHRARHSTSLLGLAYGACMHLVLDAMWRTPSVLLWPFWGPLPRGTGTGDWLTGVLTTLLTDPAAYLPEIAGVILITPFLWTVFNGVGLRRFLCSRDVN